MSGTLALAAVIAAMDREALAELVSKRRPLAITTIVDPIGLAAEYLRPESIERAIVLLERSELAALSTPAIASPGCQANLMALGLIGVDEGADNEVVPLDEVVTALDAALTAAHAAPLHEWDALPAPPSERHHSTDSWYVAGLTAVAAAAETLRALRTRPGRMNRNGSVAVATVRAISDATGIAAGHISCAVHTLISAGILTPASGSTILAWSPDAATWLELSQPERWLQLAAPTVAAVPQPLRALLGETLPATDEPDPDTPAQLELSDALRVLPQRYPLLPENTHAAIARSAELFSFLGLAVEGTLTGAARSLMQAGAQQTSETPELQTALATATAAMPSAVAGVYIQPDLSVIVPGPLAPADESALAALSQPEQTGVASTRRITEASLTEAFEGGNDLPTLRATLTRLSLTGVPQPLEYLLTSLATRVRSIIVHEHQGDEVRTRIEVPRSDLRETLRIDRSLQHLLLTTGPNPESLYSRLRSDHVLAALSDARYTASLARGAEPTVMHEKAEPGATKLTEDLGKLVDRVYAAARAEPNSSAFTRRLELAIKDRSVVTVTAEAQGRTHMFTLLPTSLSAGRLRATDAKAGVERTLPVSMITAVD